MNKNEFVERTIAGSRFDCLKDEIADYLKVKNAIRTGMEDYERIRFQKRKIINYLRASENEWNDWEWQLKNRFIDPHAEMEQLVREYIPELFRLRESRVE